MDTIQEIDIEFAGAKYLSDPDVILWNDTTKQVVDTTTLVAKAPNGSIAEIEQLAPIFGLESEPHKIITINNSNGVGIVSMVSGPTGIATCVLKTPILGYNQAPFAVNDRVFVEGIEMGSPDGSGFNSSDYNYQLFKVTQFANTSPATLTFQLVMMLVLVLQPMQVLQRHINQDMQLLSTKISIQELLSNKIGELSPRMKDCLSIVMVMDSVLKMHLFLS